MAKKPPLCVTLVERPFAVVEWEDTVAASGWLSADDTWGVARILSCGFLIEETPQLVKLAATIGLDDEEEPEVNQMISIPKGCILRMRVVRARSSKKRR